MYANNNPVVFIDPDGMDFIAIGQYARELFRVFQSQMVNNANSNETDPPNNRKAGSTPKGMSEAESPKKNNKTGTNDWLGDGGNVKYNGNAYFGTNYIGPGPDIDPHSMKNDGLLPLDMLDQAAFEHDVSYYKANTGGVEGALYELSVTYADKKLARDALHIIREYRKGGIDPVTGEKISVRTRNAAKLVYMAFKPIESRKSSSQNVNSKINHFFNYINSSIAKYH